MKFLLGFITSTIFIAIMFIGCWLYFDFPIDKNDEKQEEPNTHQTQKEQTQQQQQQQQQPTKQKHNVVTPPNMKENPQDWKEEYNEINEGTDENPYVTINGRKVDPKFVTGD